MNRMDLFCRGLVIALFIIYAWALTAIVMSLGG